MTIGRSNPITSRHRRAVGVFPSRQAAEHALHELRDSGFAMDRVSIIARDADRNDEIAGAEVRDRVGNKADDGAKVGALSGGALGGLTGLLVGLGTLAIPGVGPIVLAGEVATALATTLAGTAIGAATGGLVGALIGLGIPEERARAYNDRVSRGGYLVIVDGTDQEISQAEAILHRRGIEDYGVYDAPDAASPAVHTTNAGVANDVRTPATAIPAHTGQGIHKRAIGFFSQRRDAEDAINDLRSAGFPRHQISLVAQKFDRQGQFADLDVRDRLDNNLFGFPNDRFNFLHNRIERGDYLLMISGTEAEIQRASEILNRRGIQEFSIYDADSTGRDRYGVNPADRTVTPARVPETTPEVIPGATASQRAVGHKRAIGVFAHRRDAEQALTDLRDSGFSMNQVSLIGKDTPQSTAAGVDTASPRAGNKADEGAKAGAATGATVGGLGGLLIGLGVLAIPGIGPVLAGGAVATALATALSGGAIGAAAGGLTGGLVGLGIPENRARIYSDRLNRGDYLVIVDGTDDQVHRAETVLKRRHIDEWDIYDATDVNVSRTAGDRVDRYDNPIGSNPLDRSDRVVGTQPNVDIIDRRNDLR